MPSHESHTPKEGDSPGLESEQTTRHAETVHALQTGVGQQLTLELKKGASPREQGYAIRGTIGQLLVAENDIAVVLTNVELGIYVGEPERHGGITYYSAEGDRIVKLSDYLVGSIDGADVKMTLE